MIEIDEGRERFLYFYTTLDSLNYNWDAIRQHLLHIKASPLHAAVKLLLLALSICTIFVDSFVIIIIALITLPAIFSFSNNTYSKLSGYLGNIFVASKIRW
ncbi:hypothetical protein HZS_1209 [Henneguya salminicola]|nr:hypothetical protein HZS_1209 [Henneguya salminicola]